MNTKEIINKVASTTGSSITERDISIILYLATKAKQIECEESIELASKIAELSFVEISNLIVMMQDLMYFDTVPDEYKEIISDILGCEKPAED